ncbi:MAG: ABC transporter permease [Chitinophagaceae bacterium]|nr:ABC transporter permease [Chitinophagaceae bacterium]
MQIIENIREGIKSIKANVLRASLTASIVAIGICSLVGILTAIDSLQESILNNVASLGANTFDVVSIEHDGRSDNGTAQKIYPPINYYEMAMFMENYKTYGIPSVNVNISGQSELKRGNKKTNPNMRLRGSDENYLAVQGASLKSGRNFSSLEAKNGVNVAIIGAEVYNALFQKDEDPINQFLIAYGIKFRIVGLLEKQGSMNGDNGRDRLVLIPMEAARRVDPNKKLDFRIRIALQDPSKIETAMGYATEIMRIIRKDQIGTPLSFAVERNISLSERLETTNGYLRLGAFAIGFITLLGASIGLMNIMLVSVTERTREIGIRKAIGASPTKIRQQFLIEAIMITQIGGVAGIILGILIGNTIASFIGSDQFSIPWLWIIIGFIVGMIVGISSGYLPASKASKLDPIESLRFE